MNVYAFKAGKLASYAAFGIGLVSFVAESLL
jgi:hypothetical protein